MKALRLLTIAVCCLLVACGFHPQGPKSLAPPLHNLYLQTPDPYGYLARSLKQALKLSDVHLTDTAAEANAILAINKDENSQELMSVGGTQQTRQYRLSVTVDFDLYDSKGRPILTGQSLSETRIITLQSNQILGSVNEAQLFYRQMRTTLAYRIVNRIASPEVTEEVNALFTQHTGKKKK